MEFRWNEWNLEHVAKHGVSWKEAEMVVRGARRSFPKKIEDDKWLAWGRGHGGRFLQVIFVVDPEETVYVIHARPLNEQEKGRLRRKQR
jgi:uncharacterized DUF497 family protein